MWLVKHYSKDFEPVGEYYVAAYDRSYAFDLLDHVQDQPRGVYEKWEEIVEFNDDEELKRSKVFVYSKKEPTNWLYRLNHVYTRCHKLSNIESVPYDLYKQLVYYLPPRLCERYKKYRASQKLEYLETIIGSVEMTSE